MPSTISRYGKLAAMLSSALFLGCGGGGEETQSITFGTLPPNAAEEVSTISPKAKFSPSELREKDWLTYYSVDYPRVWPTLPVSKSTHTESVTKSDAQGVSTTFYFESGSKAVYTYDAESGITNKDQPGLYYPSACTYAPALRYQLPIGTAVDERVIFPKVLEKCQSRTNEEATFQIKARRVADEDISLPGIGTFRAKVVTFTKVTTKYSSSTSYTISADNYKQWRDPTTSILLKQTIAPDTTSSTGLAGTSTMTLVARSIAAETPLGAAINRFAGKWEAILTLSDGTKVNCSGIQISTGGKISSYCPWRVNNTDSYVNIIGDVLADGKVSATAKESIGKLNATMTGTLSGPGLGSGTFTDSSGLGGWTLLRL